MSRLIQIKPIIIDPEYPWYCARLGNLAVDVCSVDGNEIILLQIEYSGRHITTCFFFDTLEMFYEYNEMLECLEAAERAGEPTNERVQQCGLKVREALHKHYCKPAKHCRMCGCTDNLACPGGCYWVELDLCSRCAQQEAYHAD